VILPDVNVLVGAYRDDGPGHDACRSLVEQLVAGDSAFGSSSVVLAGFLRVVTHPRVFQRPSPLDDALRFARAVRGAPASVEIQPGVRHWAIFDRLCREAHARGNLVPDAWLAALAIEHGCEWVTLDRDFARFPGLRWRAP
jgi:toxin-antitoxin system PIN domain toxin